jgi:branched-chain amino acid transport system ATP-binding protein
LDGQALLEVQHASVAFGAVRAVEDVSIRLARGERHALLGTNGAGKTTLFNAITGEIALSRGRILYRGQDITRCNTPRRARMGISRTFQTSLTFSDRTVRENLLVAVNGSTGPRFGLGPWRRLEPQMRVVEETAARFSLAHLLERQVAALSYGEQREVEIAMALAARSDLLLLDEPAAGLAPHARQHLLRLLGELPRSVTMLFVEHDMDVALSLADRVSVMCDGAVVASGTPGEIRNNPLVRDIYLGITA